jgi:hypothetical protein
MAKIKVMSQALGVKQRLRHEHPPAVYDIAQQ